MINTIINQNESEYLEGSNPTEIKIEKGLSNYEDNSRILPASLSVDKTAKTAQNEDCLLGVGSTVFTEAVNKNSSIFKTMIPNLPELGQHLETQHFSDWASSGVHPEIISLNARSVKGFEVFEFLNIHIEKFAPYQQIQLQNLLIGGWIGANSIFKPDTPRTHPKTGKLVKYESIHGSKNSAIYPVYPRWKWQEIATEYGLEAPLDGYEWEWVENHTQIPVAVVEGLKKACAVTSTLPIPAIALLGHTNYQYQNSNGNYVLVFQRYQQQRLIYLCVDNDYKTATKYQVNQSIHKIILHNHLDIKNTETALSDLQICQWDGYKGIDDVLVNQGADAVKKIFLTATPQHLWVDDSYTAIGFNPSVQFNSRYFPNDLVIPKDKQLIGLIGHKGTGKTKILEKLTLEAKSDNRPCLSVVHRIQLAKTNADRLALTYIEDLEGKVSDATQISLVINSLHKVDVSKFDNAVVIIDEANQVLQDLNTSSTCDSKRIELTQTLRAICVRLRHTEGQLILADADLNESTFRYFIGLMGDNLEPYIIKNNYKENSYQTYLYNQKTPTDLVNVALTKAARGERLFICNTGQKEESKYGSTNLELLFKAHGFNDLIRIDSDTLKDSTHAAFQATKYINEICDQYQIVIATPSLASGVSIENQIPFDAIMGIFQGVGSADNVRQFLMRVRDTGVDRHIWVAEHGMPSGLGYLGNTSDKVTKGSDNQLVQTKKILGQLDQQWSEEFKDLKQLNTTSTYLSNLIAQGNNEIKNYKKYVLTGLRKENVTIIDVDDISVIEPELITTTEDLATQAKEIKKESVAFNTQQLVNAEVLNDDEYQKVKAKIQRTKTEQISLEATIISRRYGNSEVTEELLELNKKYRNIRLLYDCTNGYEVSTKLNLLRANKHVRKTEGELLKFDFNSQQHPTQQVEFIKKSGLLELIKEESLSAVNEKCKNVYRFFIDNYRDLKNILGLTIHVKTLDEINSEEGKKITNGFSRLKFNFRLIQLVLALLGLKTEVVSRKQKIRIYRILEPTNNIKAIFKRWLIQHNQIAEAWEKRKEKLLINQLVTKITSDLSVTEFVKIQNSDKFSTAWELVDTDTRIHLINKVEKYTLPNNEVIALNPNDANYSNHLQDISKWIELSLDIETFGLDAKNKEGLHAKKGRIRLIQVSNGFMTYYVNLGGRETNNGEQFKDFLTVLSNACADKNVKIIGQNLHFDLSFLAFQYGINNVTNVQDTLLGVKTFFGDYGGLQILQGGYGLGNLSKKLLGIETDKTEQKSDWGSETLSYEQITYAANDPYITFWIYKRLEDLYIYPSKYGFGKLAQDGIRDAWKLENDVVLETIKIELVGMSVDRLEAQSNLDECLRIQSDLLIQWNDLVPTLKYTQGKKLKRYLSDKYQTNINSLNKASVANMDYPEINLLKMLGAIKTPVQELTNLLESSLIDNRVRTKYNTLTGTGRFSSSSLGFKDLLNLQNISSKINPASEQFKLKPVRTCFKPSEGNGLAVVDLKGSHVRIAADVANDEVAIAGLNDESIDNHSKVGVFVAKALGHDVNWEEIATNKKKMPYKQYREIGKNTFFGWLNGAGVKTIQNNINGNSGTTVTVDNCKAASTGCKELFQGIAHFQKQLPIELSSEINILTVDGKQYTINRIQSVQNRILHRVNYNDDKIELPYTDCLAAIWSRTEATALKRAIIQINKVSNLHPEWELKIVNYVHDEIDIEFNLNYAEIAVTTTNNIIGDCFQAVLSQATIAKVSDGRETNWKNLVVENWSEK